MLTHLVCALLLPLVSITTENAEPSDTKQEARAARAFERDMVADEAEALRAQKDYDRNQGEANREAQAKAQDEASAASKAALSRKLPAYPRWGIELRFGPYRPQISDNAQVHELYELVYAGRKNTWFAGRPMQLGFEVDAYPWRLLPFLGVFGRAAYWRVSGPTRLCIDADQNPTQCTAQSVFDSVQGDDQTQLSVVPLSAGVVWRIDALRRRTVVPLQFNVKAGLDYHFWWANSGEVASTYMGHKAQGGTLGYNLSVGVAFGLEIFTKTTLAKQNSGVKNALFVEYQLLRGAALMGKDRTHRLDMTDNTLIIVGLTCEFP